MSDNFAEYQSPVPRAVQRAAQRAEALLREQGAVNVPPGPEDVVAAVSSSAGTNGDGGGGSPAPQESRESPPSDSREPPSSPYLSERQQQPEPPSPQPQTDSVNWEQRFRTVQGKYDGEVPGLHQQIRNLQNIITSMQEAAAAPQIIPPQPHIEVTPEDRELYGEELISKVGGWANMATQHRFAQLEAQNQQLRQELSQVKEGQGQTSQHMVQQGVMSQLDMDPELAGRWRTINDDTGFNDWLSDFDPYSGQQRLWLLRDAFARGDAVRTGRFFKAYLSEHTAPPARLAAPAHTQNGHAPSSAGQMRLDQLVAPGRSASPGASSGASQERRMWTNREIGAFYRDVQRGVFRGRDADKDRIEQDIVNAAAEGRVMS